MNRIPRTLAKNQNSAIKMVWTTGTRNEMAKSKAKPSEITPTAGNVNLSIRRAGAVPAIRSNNPGAAKSTTGTAVEHGAGNSGGHPPRNSSVATQETVIMLAYSAMKNEANFMLPYSTWKP